MPALTGLRFVAALWIVLHHAARYWRPGMVPRWPVLWNLLYYGYQAVGLFFVLSGFILAYNYGDGTGQMRGTCRAYYVARVARVYPAYAFSLLFAAGPYLWLYHPDPGTAFQTGWQSLALIQAWTLHNDWNGPGWSLSVEALFYLLFPLLLIPVGRIPCRRLLWSAGGLWFISVGAAVAYIGLMHSGLIPYYYFPFILYANPLFRLPEFCIGMVLGRYYALGGRLRPSVSVASGIGVVGVLLCAHLPTPLSLTGLLAPVWGALVLALAPARRSVLASAVLVALGEASYSVYLLHYPLWDWLTHWLLLPESRGAVPTLPLYALLGLYLAVLAVLSLATARFVEAPARHTLRALWGGRTLSRATPRGSA